LYDSDAEIEGTLSEETDILGFHSRSENKAGEETRDVQELERKHYD